MPTWNFIDADGAFRMEAPDRTSYLYFPLANEGGMMSVVTPTLHGDVKTGQNAFLMLPLSVEDLHNTRSARNFWLCGPAFGPWSATGNSAQQVARAPSGKDDEVVTLEAGLLWHKVTRENHRTGLRAEIVNLVPAGEDPVELMRVVITNTGEEQLLLTPTAAVPIYGRSADNLRDHRHVTSLLHRIRVTAHGVLVRPTLAFDERGHQPNDITYAVLGAEGDGTPPGSFFPVIEDFIGEGGNLEWPEAVVSTSARGVMAGTTIDGYEALGGLRFREIVLAPGESHTYVLILAILPEGLSAATLIGRYGSAEDFTRCFAATQAYWQAKVSVPAFQTGNPRFDGWMKWVTVQPTLRRLFGNSFLPYHDYGRGGRGWRDLWQDCLALLLMEPEPVRRLLLSSFGGVRIDGSNATIIGARAGEFIADRNRIARVWMDHGAWPYLTTRLYLDQSGDLAFLLEELSYFKDQHADRCRQLDSAWSPEQGTELRIAGGAVYRGTVLEHLLIQHLTAFFNVGHSGNTILLEGADWNDGMDMASEGGESVAFTALYAGNLRDLSRLLPHLERCGIQEVELAAELVCLLDTVDRPVYYGDSHAKQQRLSEYFCSVRHTVTGTKVKVSIAKLVHDLTTKADWLYNHIREREWITNGEGDGWFNGYYDNEGRRVEGAQPEGVRMTLAGQVFTLMNGIATDTQAADIVRAADRYLCERRLGGYRLNTDFGGIQLNLGRCFGFAFGHKENGAMFSHMAVMYANALYRRGLGQQGYKVLNGIYEHCQQFDASRMYPGLPEYVSERGRGMYPWLTGSASWYLLTLLSETFGVKGDLGDLILEPKLVSGQCNAMGQAGVRTQFAGRHLSVVYHIPHASADDVYTIRSVALDGVALPIAQGCSSVRVAREIVTGLEASQIHRLEVDLG